MPRHTSNSTKKHNKSELSNAPNGRLSHPHKLSIWTLWSPLRFAAISFCAMTTIAFIYFLIIGAAYKTSAAPITPLYIMLIVSCIGAAYFQIRALPHIAMDRKSFIAIHNAQTLILSFAFLISSILIAYFAPQIMFNMLMLETQLSYTFIITVIAFMLFYMYLTGTLIANIYAKFRRIREFNIPTWRIILTMPFGFSALWAPGYLLSDNTQKQPAITPHTTWYTRLTQWATSGTRKTIATFIVITTLSGFFYGFNSVLLTFALTLIFGIWTLQIGTKKFAKQISAKYTTCTILFNITLVILILGFHIFVPTTTQDVQISISEHEIINTIPES